MAVSFNLLTVFATDTNAASFATTSVSPTSGRPVIIGVQSTIASGTNPNIPTLTGNSLTYVQRATLQETSSNISRLSVFSGRGTATAGAVTADFAGQQQTTCAIVVIELIEAHISGTNGAGAIVQTATNQVSGTNAGMTTTLAAFNRTENATLGFFAINRGIAQTVGSGFSDAGNTGGSASSLQCEFKNSNDTSVDVTWSSGATIGIGIALEIRRQLISKIAGVPYASISKIAGVTNATAKSVAGL